MNETPKPVAVELESDPRFPSGPWVGFFTDKRIPGKHPMELRLTFTGGMMSGEGRDYVGEFIVRGQYSTTDGQCYWTKSYLGYHDVFYRGFNEGRGIWGTWELSFQGVTFTGGFHIWPEGMPDPTLQRLEEEADIPIAEPAHKKRQKAIPAGA